MRERGDAHEVDVLVPGRNELTFVFESAITTAAARNASSAYWIPALTEALKDREPLVGSFAADALREIGTGARRHAGDKVVLGAAPGPGPEGARSGCSRHPSCPSRPTRRPW